MKQETEYTCGPACLRVWLDCHLIIPPSEIEVAKALGTTEEFGTTISDFIKGVSHFGVSASRLSTKDYRPYDIILVQDSGYGHWVVATPDTKHYWDAWDGSIKSLDSIDTRALVAGEWFDDVVLRLRLDFTK